MRSLNLLFITNLGVPRNYPSIPVQLTGLGKSIRNVSQIICMRTEEYIFIINSVNFGPNYALYTFSSELRSL